MTLDPDRFDCSPMNDRPKIALRGGARLAFCPAPDIGHWECRPEPRLDGIWATTADAIAEDFIDKHHDDFVRHAHE